MRTRVCARVGARLSRIERSPPFARGTAFLVFDDNDDRTMLAIDKLFTSFHSS